jgi:hypothetical protein
MTQNYSEILMCEPGRIRQQSDWLRAGRQRFDSRQEQRFFFLPPICQVRRMLPAFQLWPLYYIATLTLMDSRRTEH